VRPRGNQCSRDGFVRPLGIRPHCGQREGVLRRVLRVWIFVLYAGIRRAVVGSSAKDAVVHQAARYRASSNHHCCHEETAAWGLQPSDLDLDEVVRDVDLDDVSQSYGKPVGVF
jgi:hypothetical protein